jgi:hypothetical protein
MVNETGIEPLQLSFAVTLAGVGRFEPHGSVVSTGQPLRTGGVVSLIIIRCEQLALLPQASLATQVRVIVIGQKVLDVTALNSGVIAPSQLSVAVTLAGAGTSLRHCTNASLGHPANIGGMVSFTMII